MRPPHQPGAEPTDQPAAAVVIGEGLQQQIQGEGSGIEGRQLPSSFPGAGHLAHQRVEQQQVLGGRAIAPQDQIAGH